MGRTVAAHRSASLSAVWDTLRTRAYTYVETNYANPHAPTAFFNGSATTTYSYDAIGNLATTTGAATSTFMWDYKNRMLRAWVSGATSTYQYDHTIARMRQVVGSTTTDYPNKFYSLATSTQSGTGTSTAYIWHGDTLVATIEQRLVNGVASGTATTYYVHPDHLGSTNAITDSSGLVKQVLDYYPYGAQRINTGMDASDRRFIGQFSDDATALSYLNARYYDGDRGQFLSQDPTHLGIGDPVRLRATTGFSQEYFLADPQLLGSYAYGRGNPLRYSDPQGNVPAALVPFILFGAGAALDAGVTYYTDVMQNRAQGNANPYTDNLSSPAEYGVGAIGGGATMTFLGGARAASSIGAGTISLGQDLVAGRDPDFLKAGIVTGGTFVAGTAFKGLVGASPFEKAATRGLSQSAITQGLRYETSQGLLQSGVTSIAVSNHQSRNYNMQNFNQSSGGGGSLSSVLSSLSRALSSLSKALNSLKK